MKKILSIIGVISLIGTSTTSLIACNTPQYSEEKLKEQKEKHKIDTNNENIKNHLEWIAPQEKPFNEVDNKWYYVVCRGNKNDIWEIAKFKNNFKDNKFKVIKKLKNSELILLYNMDYGKHLQVGYDIFKKLIPKNINKNYFKSVYRWNLYTQEPKLDVDKNGNLIFKDE
ncbi:lipoprotein [Spiroplasma endosymbiont of Polydrusus pterygomalis]|uniref:lipoprotein n=1 Tax=Spiroplasma endosymbiont of Polydrusus pterygomalis TaxID=3139327 RepID=UPI003CCB0CD9